MNDKTTLIKSIFSLIVENDLESARKALSASWPFNHGNAEKRKVPKSLELNVFFRDKFTCRYCGKQTIYPGALRLISFLIPDEFPFHSHWKWSKTHPAYWELSTSLDHAIPAARGGSNNINNLVTSCYKCNASKANWTMKELNWSLMKPDNSEWDGLTVFFMKTMEQYDIDNITLRNHYRLLKKYFQGICKG